MPAKQQQQRHKRQNQQITPHILPEQQRIILRLQPGARRLLQPVGQRVGLIQSKDRAPRRDHAGGEAEALAGRYEPKREKGDRPPRPETKTYARKSSKDGWQPDDGAPPAPKAKKYDDGPGKADVTKKRGDKPKPNKGKPKVDEAGEPKFFTNVYCNGPVDAVTLNDVLSPAIIASYLPDMAERASPFPRRAGDRPGPTGVKKAC